MNLCVKIKGLAGNFDDQIQTVSGGLAAVEPNPNSFMETLTRFVGSLPPFLQFLLGIFITVGILKALMMIADYIQSKRTRGQ
ncbi:MAG: hypothetical protein ACE5E9_14785 [Nitrospinaceae bacterium]